MNSIDPILPLSQSYRDRVLAHAASRLDRWPADAPAREVTQSLRTFLKLEDRRLRIHHELGAAGTHTAAARAFVLDIVVRFAFARASVAIAPGGAQTGCALLAIGGYGRGELAPFSDVDLLFLYSGQRLSEMKLLSENLLRLLWDAGLTVGHTFRTAGDCTTAVLEDEHLRTALVHARLLAGNKSLFKSLRDGLEKDRRRREDYFLAAIKREHELRRAKFGAVVGVQEPNVKESAGGLRDYQTALWLAHAHYGYTTLTELRAHNLVEEDKAQKIIRAHDFMWRIRHASHYLMNRKSDSLLLDVQPKLAKQFDYQADAFALGSERLMREYYRHARELNMFSEAMFGLSVDETGFRRFWRKGSLGPIKEPFFIRNGRLCFDGEPSSFQQNPVSILNAFALAQAGRVSFGFRLRGAMDESIRTLSADFRQERTVNSSFINLLGRRGRAGYALRLMHEVGFLGRLIPEFARIRFLVQHDLYHHYTVDEHTLRAVETLDDLHTSEDRNRAAFRQTLEEIDDPAMLYLAVLLHDIGKGRGGGHLARGMKLAEKICARLQLKESDARKVVLLVRLHVAMSHIAQRRDLNEARVVAEFARSVESLDVLNMLLLLTYADLNAVGPGTWTEWKANLLWDLYRRARRVLTGADAPVEDEADLYQYKHEIGAILPALPMSEIERHLALLPGRYSRITTPAAAAAHLRMVENLKTMRLDSAWERQSAAATKLTVCTRDRHALFADLAGTLAAHGVEILTAELNTRDDGVAIDEFVLRQAATGRAIEDHHYPKLAAALDRAAAGELSVAALIEKWASRNAPRKRRSLTPARRRSLPRVSCDNEMSTASTIIEVHALDEPGLAHKIGSVLAGLGLEIVCARIATERSDALDVFYVTDSNGEKLSDEAMRAAEAALLKALGKSETSSRQKKTETTSERGADEKNRGDYQTAFA
ncbi:MAG TPA: [protein-PII] uridylyltransferase [Pyrinomonadaceae bacterium]|nr:[protein-PII] uridylyltransferase [Pyrinomonadaceae bacterium]